LSEFPHLRSWRVLQYALIHILVENLEENNLEKRRETGRERVELVHLTQRWAVNFHFKGSLRVIGIN
jgi:hypothetical protein